MNTLLLDASVWLAVLDTDDPHRRAARKILEASAADAVALAALDLTLYEIANVAIVRWRSRAQAEQLVKLVGVACPHALERVDDDLLRRATTVAADHELTVYDASYVALARKRDWRLVSSDMADLVRPGHAVWPDDALADP